MTHTVRVRKIKRADHSFLPVVVFLAVDGAVACETGDFAVEGRPALGALQARGVPSPVDREQVKPVGDARVAAGAEYELSRSRLLLGLLFRFEGGRRAAVLAARVAATLRLAAASAPGTA